MTNDAGGVDRDREWVELTLERPVWHRFFTVSPLVLVGTRESDGFDLAPKHMAFPLGWERLFGFVCTPRHGTYHNAREFGGFTVSYPRPEQVVLAGLAAQQREGGGEPPPGVASFPTEPARVVEGVLLAGAYVQLECELERIVDGLGTASLIIGKVVAGRAAGDALRVSESSDAELVRDAPLLAYLHPGRYAEVSDSKAFPFPANFHL